MHIEEIWKPIKGYEGRYEVSSLGKIRRIRADGKHSMLHPSFDDCGYLKVYLSKDGQKNRLMSVHRIVAETYVPNPNNYQFVKFTDNNFENVSASNLYWDNSRTLRKDSRERKKVLPIRCVNTGEVFPTLLAAATHFNMSSAGLRLCIRDGRPNRVGLQFEYVKEDK